MLEPRDPTPQVSGEFDIGLKEAVLTEALGTFSSKMLEDDILFRAISAALHEDEPTKDGETDIRTSFIVTPNIRNGKYSLCLEQSAKGYAGEVQSDSGVGDMFFRLATMKYIPICAFETDETGKPTAMVEKSFVVLSLGRDVAIEKPTQEEAAALETAVRAVLGGINEIGEYCEQRGVEVVSDEFGRPQVLEIAQNTFYSPE